MARVLHSFSRECLLRTTTTTAGFRFASCANHHFIRNNSFAVGSTGAPFSSTTTTTSTTRRRLDVAIVGAPNAGKSQLLNKLTKSNVAAVSRKRHTTRNGILGARTVKDTQLVFIDTPGFMSSKNAKKEMLKELMDSASSEMKHVDYTLVVVDAAKRLTNDEKEALVTLMLQAKYSTGRTEETLLDEEEIMLENDESLEKFAIVLNKVDLVHPKKLLLNVATELGTIADECIMYNGETTQKDTEIDLEMLAEASPPIFYISALQDDGVEDVLEHLLTRATPSKVWALSAGEVTDSSPLERVQEVIREKIYRCLHREVPHAVTQVNRSFHTLKNRETGQKAIRIDQDLVIRTKSHKRLLHGKGGMTLTRIQETARRDIEQMFGCKVMLNLHVKLSKSNHDRQLDPEEYGMQSEFKL